MIIEIITIGDEILSGDILDTNKQYLSEQCWQQGLRVEYHTGIRDDEAAITQALRQAAARAAVVLVTGGLGPTVDDFTIEVAAKTFGKKLVCHEKAMLELTAWYEKKGMPIEDNNRKQAFIPEGAQTLSNAFGTAPGVHCQFEKAHFYFMPGVPREMKYIFEKHVLPHVLKNQTQKKYFASKTLKTFGSSESALDRRLGDLMHERTHIQNARIGFRFSFPEIFLKVSVWEASENKALQKLEHVVSLVKERVGEFVYAENKDDTLEKVVVEKLSQAKKTVALAESCTGGLIASRLTSVSGASQIFLGSVVSYANELKENILGVDKNIVTTYGAVSSECAEAMVRGVFEKTKADFCAAVTGIAGPTGGTPEKPVGTVHIATLCDGELFNKEYHFDFHREQFRVIVSSVVLKRFLKAVG